MHIGVWLTVVLWGVGTLPVGGGAGPPAPPPPTAAGGGGGTQGRRG